MKKTRSRKSRDTVPLSEAFFCIAMRKGAETASLHCNFRNFLLALLAAAYLLHEQLSFLHFTIC
jgi:hypothetical protein